LLALGAGRLIAPALVISVASAAAAAATTPAPAAAPAPGSTGTAPFLLGFTGGFAPIPFVFRTIIGRFVRRLCSDRRLIDVFELVDSKGRVVLVEWGDLDFSGLATETEDPRTTGPNYPNVYVFEFYAQFGESGFGCFVDRLS